MKKRVNPLLTTILTGTILLGSASMAFAATSTAPTGNVTSAKEVTAQVQTSPAKTGDQVAITIPVAVKDMTIEQLSNILNGMVDKKVITSAQKDDILKNISINGKVDRDQLSNRLNELVKIGKLSPEQVKAVLDSLSKQVMVQAPAAPVVNPNPTNPAVQR